MWLERILIVWNTLSHDYMPTMWRTFHFTFWDWSFLIAPLGLFAFLFLIFVPRRARNLDVRRSRTRA